MKKITYYSFLLAFFMLSSCSLCLASPSKDQNVRRGQDCYRKGNYEKAIEYYLKALNYHLVNSGPDSKMVADMHNCLGITYRSIGEYDKAIEHSTLATKLRPKAYGLNHSQTANPYHNLGMAYESRGSYGDYRKAAECYKNASYVYMFNYGQGDDNVGFKREEANRIRVLGIAKIQEALVLVCCVGAFCLFVMVVGYFLALHGKDK